MNITYLIWEFVVLFITLLSIKGFNRVESCTNKELGYFFSMVVGVIVSVIMLLISFVPNNTIATEQASPTIYKTSDSYAFKANDWPEQFSTNFNFVEKPVVITRHTKVNAYGFSKVYEYTIDLVGEPK